MAFASPDRDAPIDVQQEELNPASDEPPLNMQLEAEGYSITPPPPMPQRKNLIRNEYTSTQAITVRLGSFIDLKDNGNSGKAMFGGSYLFEKIYSPKWELGADMISNAQGLIHLFRKTIFTERSSFRPYYKYGLSHLLIPKESLASIVNYKNYMISGGVGFEYLMVNPISVRLDFEAHTGVQFASSNFNLGFSFGW
ncbi:MAG: hypothetical protein KDD50_10275 [Bdellovibrionales bacterium]|nr:hypothetical protein [Bdellovibrionales bacterium]